MRILGAIIAGGAARRFGSDKGSALLDGKSLIDHVVEALHPQVEALVIVGRDWPGLTTLADRPVGGLGPLAGLNGALRHAQEFGLDGVLTAGCDTLPVPPDLAERLAGSGPAFVEGHYLIGWWPVQLAGLLEQHLGEDNNRSVRGWVARCEARGVPSSRPLYNLNTPDDLAAYGRMLASASRL